MASSERYRPRAPRLTPAGSAPRRSRTGIRRARSSRVWARLTSKTCAVPGCPPEHGPDLDAIDPALAVHRHRRVAGGEGDALPRPAHHLVAVEVELHDALGEGADEEPPVRIRGDVARSGAEPGEARHLGPAQRVDHRQAPLAGEVVARVHDVQQPVRSDVGEAGVAFAGEGDRVDAAGARVGGRDRPPSSSSGRPR